MVSRYLAAEERLPITRSPILGGCDGRASFGAEVVAGRNRDRGA
jgi:hypothetical protein